MFGGATWWLRSKHCCLAIPRSPVPELRLLPVQSSCAVHAVPCLHGFSLGSPVSYLLSRHDSRWTDKLHLNEDMNGCALGSHLWCSGYTRPRIKRLLKASKVRECCLGYDMSTPWFLSFCCLVTVIEDGSVDGGHIFCSFVNLVAHHFILFISISVSHLQDKWFQFFLDLYLFPRRTVDPGKSGNWPSNFLKICRHSTRIGDLYWLDLKKKKKRPAFFSSGTVGLKLCPEHRTCLNQFPLSHQQLREKSYMQWPHLSLTPSFLCF